MEILQSSVTHFLALLLLNLGLPILLIVSLGNVIKFLHLDKYVDAHAIRIVRALLLVYAVVFGVLKPLMALITGRF